MKATTAVTWVLAGAAVLLLGARPPVSGQSPASNENVLTSLLAEVRGLRQAMEQMASAGPRIQLAVGRLQMQEQRIGNSQRRLDEVRDRIDATEREIAESETQVSRMEQFAERAHERAESEELASQVTMLKEMLKRRANDLQRLRNEEAELLGVVAADQAHWAAINARLDELERSMSK